MQLNLDCQNCDDILRRERGCNEKGIIPFLLNEERHFRCPIKLVTNTTWDYIRAYRFYKLGLLPNGTSYLNESQKYIDAMGIIENEFAKIEETAIKRAKK